MHQKDVQGDNWLSSAKGRDDAVPCANCERDSKEIAASGCSGSAQEQPPRYKELDYGYKRSKLNTDLEMQDTTHEKTHRQRGGTPALAQLDHVDLHQDCAHTVQTKSYTLLQPILLYMTSHKHHINARTHPRTLSMCAHAGNHSHGILHREVKKKNGYQNGS
jgi:hypothetical protein